MAARSRAPGQRFTASAPACLAAGIWSWSSRGGGPASPGLDLGAAERKRAAQLAKLDGEIEALERKLSNAPFVERAPAEVVQKARDDLARLRAERESL